jgi:hypothetical protein
MEEETRRIIYQKLQKEHPDWDFEKIVELGEELFQLEQDNEVAKSGFEIEIPLLLPAIIVCFFMVYGFSFYLWPQYSLLYNLLFFLFILRVVLGPNNSYFNAVTGLLKREGVNPTQWKIMNWKIPKPILYQQNEDGTRSLWVFFVLAHSISTFFYFIGYLSGIDRLESSFISLLFELLFNLNGITYIQRALQKTLVKNEENQQLEFSISESWYWLWLFFAFDWSTFGFSFSYGQLKYFSIILSMLFYSFIIFRFFDISGDNWLRGLLLGIFPFTLFALILPYFNPIEVHNFGLGIGSVMSVITFILLLPRTKKYICNMEGCFKDVFEDTKLIPESEYMVKLYDTAELVQEFSGEFNKKLLNRSFTKKNQNKNSSSNTNKSTMMKITSYLTKRVEYFGLFLNMLSSSPSIKCPTYHVYFIVVLIFVQLVYYIGTVFHFYYIPYYIPGILWTIGFGFAFIKLP